MGSVKQCLICLAEKPLDEFPRCVSNKSGILGYCFECERERARHKNRGEYHLWREKLAALRSIRTAAAISAPSKTCAACGQSKPRSDFRAAPKSKSRDLLGARCIPCLAKDGRRHQLRYAELNANGPRVASARCLKCSLEKAASEFHANRQTRSGLSFYCKPCHSAMGKEAYEGNREKILKKNRDWSGKNRGRHRELVRLWSMENPGKRAMTTRKYQGQKVAAIDEEVDYWYILIRDDFSCGICGTLVHPGEMHVDHGVPISLGGRHSRHNLQVAHISCNVGKKNRYSTAIDHWGRWAAFAVYCDAAAGSSRTVPH